MGSFSTKMGSRTIFSLDFEPDFSLLILIEPDLSLLILSEPDLSLLSLSEPDLEPPCFLLLSILRLLVLLDLDLDLVFEPLTLSRLSTL